MRFDPHIYSAAQHVIEDLLDRQLQQGSLMRNDTHALNHAITITHAMDQDREEWPNGHGDRPPVDPPEEDRTGPEFVTGMSVAEEEIVDQRERNRRTRKVLDRLHRETQESVFGEPRERWSEEPEADPPCETGPQPGPWTDRMEIREQVLAAYDGPQDGRETPSLDDSVDAALRVLAGSRYGRIVVDGASEQPDPDDGGIGFLAETEKRYDWLERRISEEQEIRRRATGELEKRTRDLDSEVERLTYRTARDHSGVAERLEALEQRTRELESVYSDEVLERISRDSLWKQLQGYQSVVDRLGDRVEAIDEEYDRQIEGLKGRTEGLNSRIAGVSEAVATSLKNLERRMDAIEEKIGREATYRGRGDRAALDRCDSLEERVDHLEAHVGALVEWREEWEEPLE